MSRLDENDRVEEKNEVGVPTKKYSLDEIFGLQYGIIRLFQFAVTEIQGGDGASKETAVHIRGRLGAADISQLENAWLMKYRPKGSDAALAAAPILRPSDVEINGHQYHRYTLQGREVWFDVTGAQPKR